MINDHFIANLLLSIPVEVFSIISVNIYWIDDEKLVAYFSAPTSTARPLYSSSQLIRFAALWAGER